jgi:hypothetical protein
MQEHVLAKNGCGWERIVPVFLVLLGSSDGEGVGKGRTLDYLVRTENSGTR